MKLRAQFGGLILAFAREAKNCPPLLLCLGEDLKLGARDAIGEDPYQPNQFVKAFPPIGSSRKHTVASG